MQIQNAPRILGLTVLGGLLTAGCSTELSGSGDGGSDETEFTILSISVLEGMEWKINRPIDITFSDDVDFSTVSQSTITVADEEGEGALGVYSFPTGGGGQPNMRVIRFQPNCPAAEDFSDAGLSPGTEYRINVLGSILGGVTVRSTSGEPLELGALVSFHTPDSTAPLELFLDTVPGPPAVRLRGASGVPTDDLDATHLEVGGERVYFVLEIIPGQDQTGQVPINVPLNHYSIPENSVAVVVHFNQPLDSRSSNLNPNFLALQFDTGLEWLDLQFDLELVRNCAESGAAVRLIPRGILPQARGLRVIVRQGFADITGDTLSADSDKFARMTTVSAGDPNPLFPGIDNPEVDEILEPFILSGEAIGSLEDTKAAFEVPRADWGGGELRASFNFGGTGGPGGVFDWHIPPGTDVILNTVSDTITGGPGGAPTGTLAVINGVIDINDMFVPETSRLIVQGPNTCTILATGSVTVLGEISVRGSDSPGVGTLNTTNQPEPGSKGNAGGGDGGVGSFLTSQSTPKGGTGQGAFNVPNGGGEGGETTYADTGKDDRRGAGGGGGRFGPDILYDYEGNNGPNLVPTQTLVGLDGERGSGGAANGLGAISQSVRAKGGALAPSPFIDASTENNFFGTMVRSTGELILGELTATFAGSGGGAGGDAVNNNTFPDVPFKITGDEKGSGGGGGGGGLKILAIGPVTVGSSSTPGVLAADGGDGGGGENVIFFDRIGGGSGGGGGGHIVISSAASLTIFGEAQNAATWYRDADSSLNHFARPISVVGGQGGAGNFSRGGANEEGPQPWRCDRIPWENLHFNDQPPQGLGCFSNLPDVDDLEEGQVIGAGGDGSPGLLQFHVPDPDVNLIFPTLEANADSFAPTYAQGLDITKLCAPPPVGFHRPKQSASDSDWIPPDFMIPFFGDQSRAQTKWIPLGLARIAPGGFDQVSFRFDGTDTTDGVVDRDGDQVGQVAPIMGPDPMGSVGAPPFIASGGLTMVLDASGLTPSDALYKENTQLLRAFSIMFEDALNPTVFELYTITAASYDSVTDRLTCHVDPEGPSLSNFVSSGPVLVSLVPHYLRVVTDGFVDSYPDTTKVFVRFDATKLLDGQPDETSHGWTADISDLNSDQWDFVRFQIEFEIELDVTSPRPGLDLLRMPYEF